MKRSRNCTACASRKRGVSRRKSSSCLSCNQHDMDMDMDMDMDHATSFPPPQVARCTNGSGGWHRLIADCHSSPDHKRQAPRGAVARGATIHAAQPESPSGLQSYTYRQNERLQPPSPSLDVNALVAPTAQAEGPLLQVCETRPALGACGRDGDL